MTQTEPLVKADLLVQRCIFILSVFLIMSSDVHGRPCEWQPRSAGNTPCFLFLYLRYHLKEIIPNMIIWGIKAPLPSPEIKKKALEMQQSVKVKLHWGSPSLSWTTGLKTKCTQSEHMSTERNKTPPVAHRYAPLPLSCNALSFCSVWTTRSWVYAVNLTFDLISVSCAHVWLWTVLYFWRSFLNLLW